MRARRVTAIAAVGAALLAFLLYRSTLLPGFDFGDTPSFQVMGGDAAITPRDAYPLYFALGAPFVQVVGDRARALNLASAAEAACATGLLVAVGVELSGSVIAAVAAALLFAGSYTFWSQAVIAEVYALHACMIALSLLLLLRWERRPTLPRLAAFFAAYAIGFGNHLGMVLLLPGYTLFLLWSAPGGWRSMFHPRVVVLAVGIATLGALQYAWNLHALWLAPVAPHSAREALAKFWVDVTKADWRESMVGRVPWPMAAERLRMYAFDVRQQFGLVAPPVAFVGLWALARRSWRRAALLAALYAANVTFALTYNVGDSHVFFLPSHLIVALLVAPALAAGDALVGSTLVRVGSYRRPDSTAAEHGPRPETASIGAALSAPRRAIIPVASGIALTFVAAMVYDNYPALDRSGDTRPSDLLRSFTAGIDDQRAILLTDLNWQVQNGVYYYARAVRRDLAWALMPDVLGHAPRLIDDNVAINRQVLVSTKARDELIGAYPSRFYVERDTRAAAPSLAELAAGLPAGTRYVLTVLKPTGGLTIDRADLARALDRLGVPPGRVAISGGAYEAIAGVSGSPPAYVRSSPLPFRDRIDLAGARVDVRMESWLAFDTIRRMGFGQVVAAHRHTLIVERGISFAAFGADGRPLRRGYAASLFAPEPRWAIVDP